MHISRNSLRVHVTCLVVRDTYVAKFFDHTMYVYCYKRHPSSYFVCGFQQPRRVMAHPLAFPGIAAYYRPNLAIKATAIHQAT